MKMIVAIIRPERLGTVNDEFTEPTVQAIIKGAKTDTIADGKIFI